MGDATLYSDTFTIFDVNAAKYDRVSRLSAHTEGGETTLTLDVNSELLPCSNGDRLQILLASTLSLDGSQDDGKGWRDVGRGEASLADEYDYVCYGKIYRFEEGDDEKIKVFVSFGGLLLYLEGPYKNLTSLKIDHVYLCLKK
ncbi:DNA-directed RNA polymerases I, II, and III subunit RPABC3 [Puttea exsequens]|nr:DNA-directed RNA polymerases I, II, and III subunit RPABC3 [Puttea exsequens]